jgi:hypothetical protein
LREDGVSVVTQLINNINETGEWPRHITEVAMIPLKKEPKATKCIDHCTVSLITHTAKIVLRILRIRMERKIKMYLEKIMLY